MSPPAPAGGPTFSVVVPTHGRPDRLRRCLAALSRLDPGPHAFEVVVVDDGGDPPAAAALGAWPGLELRLVRQAQAGPAAARNRGAAEAGGRFIAFTDDDCAPAPGWLAALARRLEAAPDALVGGALVNALPHDRYAAASQLVLDSLYGHFAASEDPAEFFATANVALDRARFRAIGGFDESFLRAAGEDRELCDRWRAAGGRLVYADDALVHHAHALSLGGLWRQHANYGRGAATFHRARARRGEGRTAAQPSLHARMARAPFSAARGPRALVLAGLVGLTQVAYVAGFVAEELGQRRTGRSPVAAPGAAES